MILLHGDVDAIKEFVFETSSLPQIRGGSQLLVECEEEVRKRIEQLGGEEIYCSGGSFLFKVPADKAKAAKRAIEELYLNHTLVATVTVVYEQDPLGPALTDSPQDGWARRLWGAHQQAQQGGDFARRVAFLSALVREAKVQKCETPFLEAFPFGRRCEACGKRMAMEEVPRYEPGEEEIAPEKVALCQVCLQRHQKGVRGKKDKARGKFNQEFWDFASPQAKQPPDLDHLVKSARRKYIAFLYADGNDIGRLLQRVQSEEEFKALSKALEEGTRQALFEALQQVCGQELQKREGYWPFEIVNIGGDDVTLLIQPGYAWEVAVEFLQRFEKEVESRVMANAGLGYWPQAWPKKITASCGIAIADVKYPVRYLERLASELLKEAKREAKVDPDNLRSAVTFLWLPNPIATEKAAPLMTYYRRDKWELTARPYRLEEAKRLMEQVQTASRWSRTLRHRWGEALEKGGWVSLNTVYYDIARRQEEQRAQFVGFLAEVGRLAQQKEFGTNAPAPLWQPYEKGWRTALLDVLELAELRATRPDVREEGE
jgi:hypothetical protein